MIGNTNDPTGAATPIVGPGNNSCTDCITIPLEEYRKLIECSVSMDIILTLADGRNVYWLLTRASDMVPRAEYQNLQNVMAEKVSDLQTELRQKGEYIANLERQARDRSAAHICPVCGRQFFETPAISRRDLKQEICSVCAATEALEDAQKAGAISRGEAKEIQDIVERVAIPMEKIREERDEVIPRQSTPEQCKKGGRKTQQGKKADLPMEEIMELKAKGWSNVRIAGRYGVTDVTIGTRIKQYLAKDKPVEKAAVEPAKTDTRRPLDIADLRARRAAGETYEHIGKEYGGWTEDEVHAFIIQKGKEKKNEDK